jgi:hypothetical protein
MPEFRVANGDAGLRPAVVVTGASAGIGSALAVCVARERRIVVLVARSPSGLNATAEAVRQAGGEAYSLELDLAARDAPARLSAFLVEQGLSCEVLVNNAGYGLRGAAATLPVAEQIGIIDLNIRALAALTLHFLPAMVARGRGGVINLGSVAGFLPGPHMAMYYSSKAFVRSFSEALHEELRGKGVTVTCVAPGPVRTKFLEKAGAGRAPLFRILPKVDAAYVAECAWRGFRRGRRMVIPGLQAKAAMCLARILPTAAMLRLVSMLQRGR